MRKFTVKLKAADGSTYRSEMDTIVEAVSFINDTARRKAEELATSEWDNFFPLRWEIIRSRDAWLINKGFVGETGLQF